MSHDANLAPERDASLRPHLAARIKMLIAIFVVALLGVPACAAVLVWWCYGIWVGGLSRLLEVVSLTPIVVSVLLPIILALGILVIAPLCLFVALRQSFFGPVSWPAALATGLVADLPVILLRDLFFTGDIPVMWGEVPSPSALFGSVLLSVPAAFMMNWLWIRRVGDGIWRGARA